MNFEKTLTISLILALVTTFILLFTYFYNFHSSLSDSSQDWANFGSYIGGILGPLYALLAFFGLLETLRQSRLQRELEGLIHSVKQFEKKLNYYSSLTVTCDSPWIWGHNLDAAVDIKNLPLRTLLESDGIDWELYLSELRESLIFRKQEDGTLFQDRDIWLKAKLASDGLFQALELYLAKGGEKSVYAYYYNAYEIQKNRLASSDWQSI